MRTDAFDYELPPELVAQRPAGQRGASRMLVLKRDGGACELRLFSDFPSFLRPGDLVVFNNTRVLKARLFGIKVGGGAKIEILLTKRIDDGWLCMIRPGKRIAPGTVIRLLARKGGESSYLAQVVGRWEEGMFHILVSSTEPVTADVCETCGHVPLPPYVRRSDTEEDIDDYQTVYATVPGAVAAPTAGLHFDSDMIARIHSLGIATAEVTLHVGPGTFQPVSAEFIDGHRMHEEEYSVSPNVAEQIRATRSAGGRIVAVGTTVVRVLESVADESGMVSAGSGSTRIFIYPPYRFRCVDALFTNFHLPKSTLLMLVCAFAGKEPVLNAYRLAIQNEFRFYSYGDCMLLI
jgi:S-adenosylmethionine:tRNA ribosyltransferase-isomerase